MFSFGGGGGGGGGVGMGQGSIGGALIEANNAQREIARAKKIDKINWKNQIKSWKESDLFPYVFGGGAGGLLTDLGSQFRGMFEDLQGLGIDLGDRATALRGIAGRVQPLQAKAEQLGSDLISGVIGQQRQAASEPVYAARTGAAEAGRSASIEGTKEILNRIDARSRAGGYGGDSLAGNMMKADAARQIANAYASELTAAEIANAIDMANLDQSIINEQLSARGVPLDIIQQFAAIQAAPEAGAVQSALSPFLQFTSAVSPYMQSSRPPSRVVKHYPSEATLWSNVGAQVLDMIEKLGWSAIQSYMGGGLGGIGGSGSAPTGGNPGAGAANYYFGNYLDRYGADRLGAR